VVLGMPRNYKVGQSSWMFLSDGFGFRVRRSVSLEPLVVVSAAPYSLLDPRRVPEVE
jgi:hypothetical protein